MHEFLFNFPVNFFKSFNLQFPSTTKFVIASVGDIRTKPNDIYTRTLEGNHNVIITITNRMKTARNVIRNVKSFSVKNQMSNESEKAKVCDGEKVNRLV